MIIPQNMLFENINGLYFLLLESVAQIWMALLLVDGRQVERG